MKKPSTRPNPTDPTATPSGLHGRLPEPPMHPTTDRTPRPPLSILHALALSLATTGCFNPLVTLETDGGSDETTDTATDASTTDEMTTLEPDSGSGDGSIPVCGNGVVEGDEACDDGVNDGSYGGCNADCTAPGPFCGDGVVNGEEPCDDGDDVDGNGCNVDCVVSGSVLWTVTYDGRDHGIDYPDGVTTDSAGNVIVSGTVSAGDDGRGWLRKYSAVGATQWTLDITGSTGPTSSGPIATLITDDTVVGGSQGPFGASRDAWVRRYSGVGEPVWTQSYASAQGGLDLARDVAVDPNGDIYVVLAETQLPMEPNERTLVRKYTPEGAELWTQFYDESVQLEQLETDGQGRAIVAGKLDDNNLWLQQLTSEGSEVWSQSIDIGGVGSTIALSVNLDGMVALAVSPSDGSHIILMSPDGDDTEVLFPRPEGMFMGISSVRLDNNGNVIAGGTVIADSFAAHGWISKYDSNGAELWNNTYDGAYDNGLSWDIVQAITTDTLGNVVAAGRIHDSANSLSNIWLAKYAP